MSAETDLVTLLANMQPSLHPAAYVFCTLPVEKVAQTPLQPLYSFHEAEGVTLVLEQEQAQAAGLPCDGTAWAWITLTIHSSLHAVGFIAAVSARLAAAGISVNPVSAYYHDHLFVPWEDRLTALSILLNFSQIS